MRALWDGVCARSPRKFRSRSPSAAALRRDDGLAARPRGFRLWLRADRRRDRLNGGNSGGRSRAAAKAGAREHRARRRTPCVPIWRASARFPAAPAAGSAASRTWRALPKPPGRVARRRRRLRRPRSALPLRALAGEQPLNQRTRATHAAAWSLTANGAIRRVARGRRTPQRARQADRRAGPRRRPTPADGFVVVTSRCSFEMVVKTAVFGARDARLRLRADLAGAGDGGGLRRRADRGRARRSGARLRGAARRRAERRRELGEDRKSWCRMANQIGDFFASSARGR